MKKNSESQFFLKQYTLSNDQIYFFQLGPLKFWLVLRDDELLISLKRNQDEKMKLVCGIIEDKTDEEKEWKRWVTGFNSNQLMIEPVMPDLPIVVRPENELIILPDESARFYILIPLWILIQSQTQKGIKKEICEIPTVILSQTWFGDSFKGELAYALKTSARRKIDSDSIGPYRVACPVNIKNQSKNELKFKRLCLEVKHLTIFSGKKHMWSNEINVTFKGVDQISQIKYSESPPEKLSKKSLIRMAREPIHKSFSKKSFDTFKFFTGF